MFHPFFVAEMFTGTPGKSLDLEATFSKFDNVLSRNYDITPATAPKKLGKLVNVRSLSPRLASWTLENSWSLDYRVVRIWF